MGNSCLCLKNNNSIKNKNIADISLDKDSINLATEQIMDKKDTITEKRSFGINELKKYFEENEKEILNNLNKKEKAKKDYRNKKRISIIGLMNDNKYELMLKRLLEQKNIKRNGPKRRETIRNDDKIKILVNDIMVENKNLVLNNKHNSRANNNNPLNRNSTLLIKKKDDKKIRLSVTIERQGLMNNINNNKVKNKLHQQYLKNINTLNEMINERTLSSGLCKKETDKKE